jgi:hypothetical protein
MATVSGGDDDEKEWMKWKVVVAWLAAKEWRRKDRGRRTDHGGVPTTMLHCCAQQRKNEQVRKTTDGPAEDCVANRLVQVIQDEQLHSEQKEHEQRGCSKTEKIVEPQIVLPMKRAETRRRRRLPCLEDDDHAENVAAAEETQHAHLRSDWWANWTGLEQQRLGCWEPSQASGLKEGGSCFICRLLAFAAWKAVLAMSGGGMKVQLGFGPVPRNWAARPEGAAPAGGKENKHGESCSEACMDRCAPACIIWAAGQRAPRTRKQEIEHDAQPQERAEKEQPQDENLKLQQEVALSDVVREETLQGDRAWHFSCSSFSDDFRCFLCRLKTGCWLPWWFWGGESDSVSGLTWAWKATCWTCLMLLASLFFGPCQIVMMALAEVLGCVRRKILMQQAEHHVSLSVADRRSPVWMFAACLLVADHPAHFDWHKTCAWHSAVSLAG